MYDLLVDVFWRIAEFVFILFYIVSFIAFLLFMVLYCILLILSSIEGFRGKSSGCCSDPSWFEDYRRRNGL